MMKLASIILIIISFFVFNTTSVSAHILESNGSIGAVMHVDPEDDPIVGQPAGFFLEFKDKTGRFDPKNCKCTITILKAGKEDFSQDLFSGNSDPSLTNASIFYTFPEKNVYTIKIQGEPTENKSFDKFTLTYDIRVTREVDKSKDSELKPSNYNIELYLLGGIAILVVVLLIAKKFDKGGDK